MLGTGRAGLFATGERFAFAVDEGRRDEEGGESAGVFGGEDEGERVTDRDGGIDFLFKS